MDMQSMSAALTLVVGVFALIGIANLVDYKFRVMAANKARTAEEERMRRWDLPPTTPMNFDV